MKIPKKVLREAFLAGTRERRRRELAYRKRVLHLSKPPGHWAPVEQLWDKSAEAPMSAAAKVLIDWAIEQSLMRGKRKR